MRKVTRADFRIDAPRDRRWGQSRWAEILVRLADGSGFVTFGWHPTERQAEDAIRTFVHQQPKRKR